LLVLVTRTHAIRNGETLVMYCHEDLSMEAQFYAGYRTTSLLEVEAPRDALARARLKIREYKGKQE
jgi:hypothetical protein